MAGRALGAIGIGSLFNDGLGDTIRVSLTEDPIYDSVARDSADKAMALWNATSDNIERRGQYRSIRFPPPSHTSDRAEPQMQNRVNMSQSSPRHGIRSARARRSSRCLSQQTTLKDNQLEGLQVELNRFEDFESFTGLHEALHSVVQSLARTR